MSVPIRGGDQRGSGGQLPYVATPTMMVANTTAALAANTGYLQRFRVAAPLTIGRITYFVGTASGNVDVGVYRLDGGDTLTRLASSGSTAAVGAAATHTVPLTASVTLVPGVDYYLAFAPDNATVTIGRTTPNSFWSSMGKTAVSRATSFPLPASMTYASVAGSSTLVNLYAEP